MTRTAAPAIAVCPLRIAPRANSPLLEVTIAMEPSITLPSKPHMTHVVLTRATGEMVVFNGLDPILRTFTRAHQIELVGAGVMCLVGSLLALRKVHDVTIRPDRLSVACLPEGGPTDAPPWVVGATLRAAARHAALGDDLELRVPTVLEELPAGLLTHLAGVRIDLVEASPAELQLLTGSYA